MKDHRMNRAPAQQAELRSPPVPRVYGVPRCHEVCWRCRGNNEMKATADPAWRMLSTLQTDDACVAER